MAKIIFSRRGGLSYAGFRSYLERLRDNHRTKIHWPVIDIAAVDAQDHSRVAALQIADCGVSAIAAAIEPDPYGNVEHSYLHEIAGNISNRDGNYLSYGLKSLPTLDQSGLTPEQAAGFQRFR
ncbi:MAG: hypothetical protein AAF367_17605 [Pseudomonadota bacterium]